MDVLDQVATTVADDIDTRRLSLGEHLEELRRHLFKASGWMLLALVVCFIFQDPLMDVATRPHRIVMDELDKEATWRDANKHLAGGLVAEVAHTLDDVRDLERDVRAVDRNSAILKEKLDAHPEEQTRAINVRRAALSKRAADLRAEQEKLLGSTPDAAKLAEVEKQRLVLDEELKQLLGDARALAALSQAGEIKLPRSDLIALKYTEGFMAYLKVAFVCAIFLASPLIARELWKFVGAGLYRHEKKYVVTFAPLSFFVFLIGCSFGYFVLVPSALKFLATYGAEYIQGQFALGEYLSLFLSFTLAIGLIFELPLAMCFMALIGFVTPDRFASFRRYWVLVAFILGAILSPTADPFNQTLCAGPLIVLYEIGIWLSRWVTRSQPAPSTQPVTTS